MVKGIPFHLEQLFTNLVSNAIKYRHPDRQPHISIICEKIHRNDITYEFDKSFRYYQRIQVTDNGLGFDQKYAHKIFELFQRLHQKHEFSGTGIGLSICKRIIEKHRGFITTEATKDKGATFIVFLPV